MKKNFFHRFFIVGVFIKGIDGVLELIGGVLLLLTSKAGLNVLVIFLTQRELSEDPGDRIANYLLQVAHDLTLSTKLFGVFYLLGHGAVKVFLGINLLRERLWAFPVAIGILTLFVLYQTYRLGNHFSPVLLFLTAFDVAVLFSIWREHRVRLSQSAVIQPTATNSSNNPSRGDTD